MSTTRRGFIKAAAATAGGLLVPTWLPRKTHAINLAAFCQQEVTPRYDLTKPFVQGDPAERLWRYGTDAGIIVRVPDAGVSLDDAGKTPPATRLPWEHAERHQWAAWPAPRYIDLDDEACPACDGKGCKPAVECERCYGVGMRFWAEDDLGQTDEPCHACQTTGYDGPRCATCKGTGQGRFPAALEIAPDLFVAAKYDRLMRCELPGLEWAGSVILVPDMPTTSAVVFRFAGGEGLLMPMFLERIKERMGAISR